MRVHHLFLWVCIKLLPWSRLKKLNLLASASPREYASKVPMRWPAPSSPASRAIASSLGTPTASAVSAARRKSVTAASDVRRSMSIPVRVPETLKIVLAHIADNLVSRMTCGARSWATVGHQTRGQLLVYGRQTALCMLGNLPHTFADRGILSPWLISPARSRFSPWLAACKTGK
jgi:hypothetical protein